MKLTSAYITLFLLAFHNFKICNAQNLIPNGDFEQFIGCPLTYSQLDSAMFWFNPAVNPGPGGSPDYFNQCAGNTVSSVPGNFPGYQPAHSGVAYGGIIIFTQPPFNAEQREYMETPLLSALVANTCYHFEMYVNYGNECIFAVEDLGVYFSNSAITGIMNFNALPFTPQISNTNGMLSDTVNWVLISGDYTAAGGENHIIIGNFNNDTATTYTQTTPFGTFQFSYYYIDDVSLSVCTGTGEQHPGEQGMFIFTDPLSGSLTLTFPGGIHAGTIKICNILGKKIMEENNISSFQKDIRLDNISPGIYFVSVFDGKNYYSSKVVLGRN